MLHSYAIVQEVIAYERDDDPSLKILKLLMKKGGQIPETFLFQSLLTAPGHLIAELFENQTIDWNLESARNCLSKVQSRQEELIWEVLKKAGWPFHVLINEENKGALQLAIEERNFPFVQWLLKQEGLVIQDTDLIAAWECGDLEILECLISPQEIIQEILENKSSLEEKLQRYFLFTEFKKVEEYILLLEQKSKEDLYRNNLKDRDFDKKAPQNSCPEQATIADCQGASEDMNFEGKLTQSKIDSSDCFGISRIFTNALGYTAVLARYTRKNEILDLIDFYDIDTRCFVQNQMELGRACHEAVLKKVQDLRCGEIDLMTMLLDFAKVRHKIAVQRMNAIADRYLQFRTIDQEPLFPSGTHFGGFYEGTTRYRFSIPWIHSVYNNLDSQEVRKNAAGYGYTLYYCHSETSLWYPLTEVKIDGQGWKHTAHSIILELWPEVEKMHRQLLAMSVDIHNSLEVKMLQEKLATTYWLGCNLINAYHGNGQYFSMWLSALVQYHGFEPMLAKRQTPQPDCLAISLPLSEFVAAFPHLYENPLHLEGKVQSSRSGKRWTKR